MTLNEKLRQVIMYLKDANEIRSIADFADKLGRNRSNISEIASGRGSVTQQFALDIHKRFPTININYLTDEDCEDMIDTEVALDTERTARERLEAEMVINESIKRQQEAIRRQQELRIHDLEKKILELNDQIVWMRNLIDKLSK